MWRLWRVFTSTKGILGILFTILVAGPLSNWLYAIWARQPQPHFSAVLAATWPRVLGVIVVLGLLSLWSYLDYQHRQHASADRAACQEQDALHQLLRQQFSLLKRAMDLRPEDLRFRELASGDQPDLHFRPFYASYIPRHAVLQTTVMGHAPPSALTEQALAQRMQQGESVVLIGPPLSGKSRTLYDVVRRMDGFDVVRPLKDRPAPGDDAFTLLCGRRLVLLLDDLDHYVNAAPELLEFCRKLDRDAASWVIAATCRDGSELAVVQEAVGTGLDRFYEEIGLKLQLVPLTSQEKERLAHDIGQPWVPGTADLFPTPGSITMAEPLVAMRQRFERLLPEHQDTLQALQLCLAAGVWPFTHRRLKAILGQLFHRPHLHLGDSLDLLRRQAFLLGPSRQDPIVPEVAYLVYAVSYQLDRVSSNDLDALAEVLQDLNDAEALFRMGTRIALIIASEQEVEHQQQGLKEHQQQGLNWFEQAIRLQPDFFEVWLNKGVVLVKLGRTEEALDAYERALRINPDYPKPWNNKGAVLVELKRYEEALDALEEALRLQPKYQQAWSNKSLALMHLGRYQEALDTVDRALELWSDDYRPWYNKAAILFRLERHEEAVDCVEHALQFKPDSLDAWPLKARALLTLRRYQEALEAYERLLALDPENAEAMVARGVVLTQLGRDDEALDAYDHALTIRSNDVMAWGLKGLLLARLHRYQDAIASLNRALDADSGQAKLWATKSMVALELRLPTVALDAAEHTLHLDASDYEAWNNKGKALALVGRLEEAVAVYERSLSLQVTALTLTNMGVVLVGLGRVDEALAAWDRALQLRPDSHEAWSNKSMALKQLGRYQEALEACGIAIYLMPDSLEDWSNKVLLLIQLECYQEALGAVDDLVCRDPDDAGAWSIKCLVLVRLERYQEALEACDKAIHLQSDSWLAWSNKGFVMLQQKRYQEALAIFDQAFQLNPNHPGIWLNKGEALARAGQCGEAMEWICCVWRLREQHPNLAERTAQLLREFGHDPASCEDNSTPLQA